MLWEIEVRPSGPDPELDRVRQEFALLTHGRPEDCLIDRTARGYVVEGEVSREQAQSLAADLLVDPLVESGTVRAVGQGGDKASRDGVRTVLPKPGVMDPVALSVMDAARDLGISLTSVRTFRRYFLDGWQAPAALNRIVANEAIEQIVAGPLVMDHLGIGTVYEFHRKTIALRELDDGALEALSRSGQLSLNLAEMKTIQARFSALGRDPTDLELETLAQTWSEHCSHKTLKGTIEFEGRRIANLLGETIFAATREIRRRLGAEDWCVSVFEDNAGVIRFTDEFHVCFKVETHNHPSAIEPYGGANTGLGGVIRDPLGTGLGALPIANTDVFCFAPPDISPEDLPPGVLHPKKVMVGVVAGVRDYGNRMGIPTVNGALCFDERYLANPLVFCGTVGLIPVERAAKEPRAGDVIVVVGGATGRDGIHGATFSSVELSADSESVSGGAVQIGNAIAEKKMLDVIIQARDRGLYHAITDCGAGGLSSAVGEMGAGLGAVVHLDRVPLKYAGLSYTEIWISESQERMVLAVPPEKWFTFRTLCAAENVEATDIGRFDSTGRLQLFYHEHLVGDLEMEFLHRGRPAIVRKARVEPLEPATVPAVRPAKSDFTEVLLKILGSYNVCSKEWIVRQYDHEVQGATVIKPLVGRALDGPGDAAVLAPVRGTTVGLAIGCGINPGYGDLDPYWMAAAAVDEAIRNVVAVGADPARIALLDNFCWGNTDRPEVLGSLVRAAEACRDAALAYGTPFISGKDSLNNEYHSRDRHVVIPPTLLISALGRVPDIRRCVTADLKAPGNLLYLVGTTRNELGGSAYFRVTNRKGGRPPHVDFERSRLLFHRLHDAIRQGLVRSCHDLSEGGLAVAVAEMAFAGEVGADVTSLGTQDGTGGDDVWLFAESTSRFIAEVEPARDSEFRICLGANVAFAQIGRTCEEPRLRIAGASGKWIIEASLADLKEAWQRPLRW